MRLSIIIPLYNSGHFLHKCIDSLLNQDIQREAYEILIINDGSTDNSLEVATTFEEKHSNITVHSKANGGVGSARNFGLSLSKGEYIYFIDPDDYLAPGVLKTLLNVAKNNSLDILTFISQPTRDSKLYNECPDFEGVERSKVYSGIEYIAHYPFQNEVWWYLIKRSFIQTAKITFIEDRWMEDAIITAQLFIAANKMAKLPLDTHRHLIVEGSAMTSKEPEHYLKVIDDNRNAAVVYESLINDLVLKNFNPNCINRLRTKQQSFVFFMMVRMLKSTIDIGKVKLAIEALSKTGAYPFTDFISKDYNGISYIILTRLFNNKKRFYFLFRLFNPILRFIS
ncbi:glycosyltransferase [uncultured Winogradskyella sp.]|uniref:glycosyltransferase n=1 Tax=uncultured Winogradskyella sp. TaxID=395353 RepID=UPI00261555A2|nr:glycosyltransferase [uncultured Winogradskyella sp.]